MSLILLPLLQLYKELRHEWPVRMGQSGRRQKGLDVPIADWILQHRLYRIL